LFLSFCPFVFSQNVPEKTIQEKLKAYSLMPSSIRLSKLVFFENDITKNNAIHDTLKASVMEALFFQYYEAQKIDSAIIIANKALSFSGILKKTNPAKYANANYMVAFFYHQKYYYKNAITYYKEAIKYHPKNSYKAYCYKLIAGLNEYLGDYENEEINILNAKLLLKNPEDDFLTAADIANQEGIYFNIYEKPKEAQKALNLAQKYYDSSKSLGILDEHLQANIYINQALLAQQKNDIGQADLYFKKAENSFLKTKNKIEIVSKIYSNQVIFFVKNKDFKKAEYFNINALKNLEKLKLPEKNRVKALVYYNAGYFYLKKKDYQKALVFIEKSLTAFPNLNLKDLSIIRDKHLLFFILKDLALSYSKIKETKKAFNFFTLANNVLTLMRQEHQGQESKNFWRENTREFYEAAIDVAYQAKDIEKAYFFIEKSRALLLLDELKENNARKALSKADLQKENNYIQNLAELSLQLQSLDIQSQAYQKKLSEIAQQKLTFNDFKKELEQKYPVYFNTKYAENFKSIQTLQTNLKETGVQAFVSYFMGDSATFAIKISPTSAYIYKLENSNKKIETYIALCADINFQNSQYASFLKNSHELYLQLVAPLTLSEGRLIISTDGTFLPFETLSSSAQKPEYLLNKYAISYAYSANILLQSQLKQNERKSIFSNVSFIGFAPAKFNKTLLINDLPLSLMALSKLTALYDGDQKIEHEATKANFIKEFKHKTIVQLYSHADIDSLKKQPVFYLTDTPLNMHEIAAATDIKTQLMVLSACKTGLGKNIKGEGVYSISRAFSAIGIPSIISTLWSVDEKANYEITQIFHENIKKGLTKDLALQQAKLSFTNQSSRNTLPALWASSILIGDVERLFSSQISPIFIIFALIIIVILLFFRFKSI
jgi:CHAT domain-containing protein